ncbi:hypothetical protein G5C60_12560 [Streptomyces sp. HC44]|uniref:Uncharacterized protein n=1 Tax=Streptomyces scabichelini TaxID=2711217 RepID=A0A6G4V2Y0_9ACTN|nr:MULTISPECIES: hypothetical protein [Streptomyces]NGO08428.1 hypothetical protein [Streptomyces scabichelini]
MNEPTRIDMSELNEPGAMTRLVAGPGPIEVTDHGEVIHVLERYDRPMRAEELIEFWESGGGIDREMLDEIDALFSGSDEYTESGDEAAS